MKNLQLFFGFYFVVIILLFLYSYTQVDLSLTLSRAGFVQNIEKAFQHIGYFNRPLSTVLYCVLLGLLTSGYLLFLRFVWRNKISRKQFWTFLILITVVLMFAYNAFSYDFFNYIFDAKIFTHYHQNPYTHTALDFAPQNEPMLSFMHWTHRTYPYGPLFLGISIVLSFLGHNIFILSFFIFKLAMAACFLLTVYFLEKISQKINPKTALFATAFFALNPLSLIESLVSAHNDIMMIFFAVAGLYFLIHRKWILGIILTILSPLIKQSTIFLVFPLLFYLGSVVTKKKFNTENLFRFYAAVMLFAFLFYVFLGNVLLGNVIHSETFAIHEIQPWYFLWVLPFIALLRPNYYLFSLTIGVCLGLLLRYVPFLWQGDWNGLAIPVRSDVVYITPIVFLVFAFLFRKFSMR